MKVKDILNASIIEGSAFVDMYLDNGRPLVHNATWHYPGEDIDVYDTADPYLECEVTALKPCVFVCDPCLEVYVNTDDVKAVWRKEGWKYD